MGVHGKAIMAVRLSLFQLQSSSAGLFADKKRCGLK